MVTLHSKVTGSQSALAPDMVVPPASGKLLPSSHARHRCVPSTRASVAILLLWRQLAQDKRMAYQSIYL
jgi:hypothetical protein